MSIFFEIQKIQSRANGKYYFLNFDLGHGLVPKSLREQVVEGFVFDDNLVEALAKNVGAILLPREFLNGTDVWEFEFRSLLRYHFQRLQFFRTHLDVQLKPPPRLDCLLLLFPQCSAH